MNLTNKEDDDYSSVYGCKKMVGTQMKVVVCKRHSTECVPREGIIIKRNIRQFQCQGVKLWHTYTRMYACILQQQY